MSDWLSFFSVGAPMNKIQMAAKGMLNRKNVMDDWNRREVRKAGPIP
jgi:hypothetical protein